MNVKVIAIVGAAGLGLYLVLHRSGASAVQAGQKNAGIGGAKNVSSVVKAFPIGPIASSLSSIFASSPKGSGTHSPVDPAIKAPGTVGPIVTSYDQIGAGQPDDHAIVTHLDGYDTGAAFPDQVAEVAPDDYGQGYSDD